MIDSACEPFPGQEITYMCVCWENTVETAPHFFLQILLETQIGSQKWGIE